MEIELSEIQDTHAKNILQKFKSNKIVLDTSFMGLGKSIIFIWTMKMLNVKNIVLLCPLSMVSDWENYKTIYNLNIVLICSYEYFRGSSTNYKVKLKHNLLFRHSDGTFEVTPEFQQLVEEGVVICCDESYKLKNICDLQKAIMTCNQYVKYRHSIVTDIEEVPFSGFYCISTLPFDKKEQCINFCYTSGIITQLELVSKDGTNLGLKQLYDFCLKLNSEKTKLIMGVVDINYKNAFQIAYQLCIEVLFPSISSFIVLQNIDLNKKQTIFNAYINIPPIGMKLINITNDIVHNNEKNIGIEEKEEFDLITDGIIECNPLENRKGIIHGLITSQTIKSYYMYAPMAKQCLMQVENCKVVIFVDYKESIYILNRELIEFNPLIITGSDSIESRVEKKNLFQQPNLDYRVIITMSQVSSMGVEFDDKYGQFPRIGFEITGYVMSNYVQTPGRICRKLTLSKSLFFFLKILTNDDDIELSIDRNINEKSKVFYETLRNNGIISPNNFQIIYHPNKYNINDLFNFEVQEVKEKPKIVSTKGIVITKSSLKKSFI